MHEPILTKSRIFSLLPPEWPEDLFSALKNEINASGRKVVVLDDDPTGTQTVHGIPVLTNWPVEALEAEIKNELPAFYILTNSRSLSAPEALALSREIGTNLKQAAARADREIEVISRSDSTLRGHFPGEVDALMEVMNLKGLPCLVIPFFLEGGRFTIDDIHYVAEGDRLVPAAQTAYARDAVFGYRHSNMRRWIEEKTRGLVPFHRIESISLEDIRRGGPGHVAEQLSKLKPESFCVVNAVSHRDLEVFVSGLLEAEHIGCRFIFRTAASFVRVRAGIAPRGLLERDELTAAGPYGGLIVVGSYVPKTTAQLKALKEQTEIVGVEMRVEALLEPDRLAGEIDRITETVDRLLGDGEDVALFTSRRLVKGASVDSSLDIGRRVSESLITVVKGVSCRPRYLVAKGGITSSDVATKALQVRRAMVMGQVLPGVPVWKLGKEARYPGMAYIVFPGNVGETDALVKIQKRLTGNRMQRKTGLQFDPSRGE